MSTDQLREALQGVVAIYDAGTTGYLVEDAFNKARTALASTQQGAPTCAHANTFHAKTAEGKSVEFCHDCQGIVSDSLPCGHHASLLVKSAETGKPLYCELCDDRSGRRDAEARETELLAAHPSPAAPQGQGDEDRFSAAMREAARAIEASGIRDGVKHYIVQSARNAWIKAGHPTQPAAEPGALTWDELSDALATLMVGFAGNPNPRSVVALFALDAVSGEEAPPNSAIRRMRALLAAQPTKQAVSEPSEGQGGAS